MSIENAEVLGKQGLGFDVIIDGLSLTFDMGIYVNDPGELSGDINYIETTHTKTRGSKTQQPEELNDFKTREMEIKYNAGNAKIKEFMKSSARKTLRYVEEVHPLHEGFGANNGGFRGIAYVTVSNLANPIDGHQTATLTIAYQTSFDEDEVQQADYTDATAITITPVAGLVAANIVAGDKLADVTIDGTVPFNMLRLVEGDTPGTDDADNGDVAVSKGDSDRAFAIIAKAGVSYAAGSLAVFVGIIPYDEFDAKEGDVAKADMTVDQGGSITLA